MPTVAHLSTLQDWLGLFWHCLSLSLLTVGGALSAAPDLQRYLVIEQRWLTDAQFAASLALAQSAPGPNVLYVAMLGLQAGMNSGTLLTGIAGMLTTLSGILLPSSVLTYFASRWGHANRHLRAVRAFRQGMAPIVVGLMCASAWVMALANNGVPTAAPQSWAAWLVTVLAALLMMKTRIHLLVLIGAGALLGWFGLV